MDTLDKILLLLKSRKIEQQEFANAIGLKKQVISEWKNGKTKSYLKYIDKIANYFNVTSDYLLGTETRAAQDEQPLSDSKKQLLEIAKRLTEDEAVELIKIAELFERGRKQ